MNESSQPLHETSYRDRLSIQHLLAWTAGIALAITIAGGVKWLRMSAQFRFYGGAYRTELDAFDYLTACVYGTSFVLFLFAVRSPDFWSSPGKIILMIMALMCIIDWILTIVACEMIYLSSGFNQYPLFNIYFANLSPTIGYALSIPINLMILFRSRSRGVFWKLTWIGFLLFGVSMFMLFWFPGFDRDYLPGMIRRWYFETSIGIPMVAMTIGFWTDVFSRKSQVDWWTSITCTLLPAVWLAHVVMTAVSRM